MPRILRIIAIVAAVGIGLVIFVTGGKISAQSEDVIVTAEVLLNGPKEDAIINFSTITVVPSVVPVGGSSLITVTIIGEGHLPLAGETVEIFIIALGFPPGAITLTQPTDPTDSDGKVYGAISSNYAGLVTVRARVTTYDHDITIADTDNVLFEPVAVPIMQSEPQFTAGDENTVYWTGEPLLDDFQIEVSRNANFTDIAYTTGWLDVNEYVFDGLEDGQIYYYRVRARNKYNIVGEWSNVVYSIQDATPPWSDVISVEVVEEDFVINFQAADIGSGVDFVRIYVSRDGGDWVFLGQDTESPVSFTFEELADIFITQRGTYCFYTQAVDEVGNEESFNPSAGDTDCVVVGGDDDDDDEEGPGEDIIDIIVEIVQDIGDYLEFSGELVYETIEGFRGKGSEVSLALVSISAGASAVSFIAAVGATLSIIPILISEFLIGIGSYFGLGGKRRPWGIVYDSVTKDPVSRAVVRLFRDTVLEQTVVTDPQGVFSFTLDKGEYTIDVQRQGYKFPSSVVVTETDGMRKNIYRGKEIVVQDDKKALEVNVPIDPIKVKISRKYSNMVMNLFISLILFFTPIFLIVGVIFAVLCFLILRENIYIVIVIVNVFLFGWTLYTRSKSYNKWGIALDERGKPIAGVDIGLFDVVYDRLIEHRVTDDDGRFHFIVPGGGYHLRPITREYISTGEDPEKGNRVGKESDNVIIIAENIELRKVQKQTAESAQ